MDDERSFAALNIQAIGEAGDRFRFRLSPGAGDSHAAIVFEMTDVGLMALLSALQGLQAKHRIPVPPSLRPKRGRPNLTVVTDDET